MPKGQGNNCIHQASYIFYDRVSCAGTIYVWLNGKFIFTNPVHLGRKYSVLALVQENRTIT